MDPKPLAVPPVKWKHVHEPWMDEDIMNFFPEGKTPRKGQPEILRAADKALRDGYRFVGIEVPTGGGKSIITKTLANKWGPAFVNTSQNILLNQYSNDFPDMVLVKGASHYTCGVTGKGADVAPCVQYKKKRKVSCNLDKKGKNCSNTTVCEYASMLKRAMAAKIALFNYHSFHFQRGFKKRAMMINDEAHGMESFAFGLVKLTLRSGEVPGLMLNPNLMMHEVVEKFDSTPEDTSDQHIDPTAEPIDDPDEEGEYDSAETPRASQKEYVAKGEYYEVIRRQLVNVIMRIDVSDSPEREKLMREQTRLENLLERMAEIYELQKTGELEGKWVLGWSNDKKPGSMPSLEMKPVFVGDYIRRKILSRAERVIFTSATILNAATFFKSVGVDPREVFFITVGSGFPVENRLIHCYPVADLSFNAKDKDYPRLIAAIRGILKQHPNECGIIHSHTWKYNELLFKHLGREFPRLMFQTKEEKREDLLARHAASKNGVLVAPAMHEGLDLKDDLSRFQIILKVPYPDMKDPQIAARMKIDQSWYGWITMLKLVQSTGRSIRSATDYAKTYMLDKGFQAFKNRSRDSLPKWVEESLRFYNYADDILDFGSGVPPVGTAKSIWE